MNVQESDILHTYIVPRDVWCNRNPFRQYELHSWYMVSDRMDNESNIRANRKMEPTVVPKKSGRNAMIGICYLMKEDANIVRSRVAELCHDCSCDGAFWEESLYRKNKMIVPARVVRSADVAEINTYGWCHNIVEASNFLPKKTVLIKVPMTAI